MSMTKKDKLSRDNMIFRLLDIAQSKGIEIDFFQMSEVVDKLHRYETTLHTIAEKFCNEDMSDKE